MAGAARTAANGAASKEDAAPLLADEAGLGSSSTPKARGFQGLIRKLFLSHHNKQFALDAELSWRASVVILITGLPFIIENDKLGPFSSLMNAGMYTVSVVIFVFYNINRTIGETVQSSFAGFKGTMVAITFTWFLKFIFPSGVTEDTSPFVTVFGVVSGAAYITTLLLLNFSMSTKIFGISNFVGWWMSFLKPGDDGLHCPWTQKFDFVRDGGMHVLMTTVVGFCLTILGSVLPYPLWALDSARDTAQVLTDQLCESWDAFIEYLSSDSQNKFHQDQVYRKLKRLVSTQGTLTTHIDNAWWECFGLGRSQRVRRKLRRLDHAIQESYDCLNSVWVTSMQAEWHDKHTQLLKKVNPELTRCQTLCKAVMNKCVKCACEGVMTDAEETELGGLLGEVRTADTDLCKKFLEQRRVMKHSVTALESQADVNREYIEELAIPHTLAFNVSGFTRVVVDLADGLIKSRHNQNSLPTADAVQQCAGIFKGVADNANAGWTVRALLSIFTGFAVGYFGYEDLLAPYTPTVAGSCAVLLSKFTGSAIVKNLGRVQGVVLGLVVGQMVHAFFDECSWWQEVALGISVFVFAFFMMYIHLAAPSKYAYIGTLAAVFGVQQMLLGKCEKLGSEIHLDKTGTYNAIICNVLACCLIIFFDILIAPGRPSAKAHKSVQEFFDLLDETIASHFNPSKTNISEQTGAMKNAATQAETLGQEAANEPRFWRTQWKEDVFNEVVRLMMHLRFDVRGLESCMAEDFTAGGAKNEVLVALLATEAFPRIGKELQMKVGVVKSLCDVFVHETEQRFPGFKGAEATWSLSEAEAKSFDDLVVEMRLIDVLKRKPASTLREDPLTQISMAVASIKAVFKDLREMQHHILRSH